MNVVLSKLQDNRISYKITNIIFNGKKRAELVYVTYINSNICARQDYLLSIYVGGAAAQ